VRVLIASLIPKLKNMAVELQHMSTHTIDKLVNVALGGQLLFLDGKSSLQKLEEVDGKLRMFEVAYF
jgi:hypothetical protein